MSFDNSRAGWELNEETPPRRDRGQRGPGRRMVIAQAASSASASQPAPGLFLLAWGLFATVVGLGAVTNYRGFAEKFARQAYASASSRRLSRWQGNGQRPPDLARRTRMLRLICVPFAIVGPIVTIVGLIQILSGHVSVPHGPRLPLPMALAFVAIAAVAVGQHWRRNGFFLVAAQKGGWMCAAAIIASVGAFSFGVFTSLGQTTIGIVGWLVGGLASVPLLMSRKSGAETPADSPGHAGHGEDQNSLG